MFKNIILFHFKRDLRLDDNAGLFYALKRAKELTQSGKPTSVICFFIFDKHILNKISNKQDRRVVFIHHHVHELKKKLQSVQSDLLILFGDPLDELLKWKSLNSPLYRILGYYSNYDDDPYPINRDQKLKNALTQSGIEFKMYKDHHIFSRSELLTQKQKPYTVFAPYKKAWIAKAQDPYYIKSYPIEKYINHLLKWSLKSDFELIQSLGFYDTNISLFVEPRISKNVISHYKRERDFPSLNGTSNLGIHLRFGTISIRKVVQETMGQCDVFLSEIQWRDFFAQILFHFPYVTKSCFHPSYERVEWRQSTEEFNAWREGQTGYPLVDAGMRELIATGMMHNRVRMVVASFLCKHLLHYWHEGERYFSQWLLDYDLASNNGNWQWSAGTGCDAAPYFRVFNPESQREKFDVKGEYIQKWVPEWKTARYPKPIIEHASARVRALEAYKKGLMK